MRKAVLCFVHKDPDLINTQIRQFLSVGNTDIYIHLDSKAVGMKVNIIEDPHVFYISNSISITWGDDSMMRALFNSWKEIFLAGKNYDYFIMTTGQDLIVKNNLDAFLLNNNGKIWIDSCEQDSWRRRVLSYKFPKMFCKDLSKNKYIFTRIFRSLYFRTLSLGLAPKRKLSFDISQIKFYYSFNWSLMPFSVFQYCVKYLEANPSFKEIFLNTILPEDSFLGTLIMNSPYRKDVVLSHGNHCVTQTFHYPFTVHPKILTVDDIPQIESSDCYFARKFDSKIDQTVIQYFKNKVINF